MTEFWIQENDKYMLNDLCNIIDGRGNRGQLFKLSVGHKVIGHIRWVGNPVHVWFRRAHARRIINDNVKTFTRIEPVQQPVFFQKKESSSITIHLAGMSFTIPARMFVGNLVYLTDMIKNAKKISHSRTLHALQDILEQSYKLAYSDCSAQINLAGSQKRTG